MECGCGYWYKNCSVIYIHMADKSYNGLRDIPDECFEQIQVSVLILAHNEINFVDSRITDLRLLTFVDLSHNRLKSVPLALCDLPYIKVLLFSNNLLSTLPPEVENLTLLEELDIRCNKFQDFPAVVCRISHLHCLLASYNYFTFLPSEIGQLQSLRTLDLEYTNMIELPSSIALMVHLETLKLDGNPLQSPPLAIVSRGLGHIMAYLVLQSHGFQRKSIPSVPSRYLTDQCNPNILAVDHEPNSVSSAVSITSNRTLCGEDKNCDDFTCCNVMTPQDLDSVTPQLFTNAGIQSPGSTTPAQNPKFRKKSNRRRPDSGYSTTDGPGGGSPQSEDRHLGEVIRVDQVICNEHSEGNSDGTDLTMRLSPQHRSSPPIDEEPPHMALKKMDVEREAKQPKRPTNSHTVQKAKQQTNHFSYSRDSVRFASHRFAGRPSQASDDGQPSRRSQSATGYRSTCLKRTTDRISPSQTTVNPKLLAWVTTGPSKEGTPPVGHTTGKPYTPKHLDSTSQPDRSNQQLKSSARFQRATRPRAPSAANTRSVVRHGETHEVAIKQRHQGLTVIPNESECRSGCDTNINEQRTKINLNSYTGHQDTRSNRSSNQPVEHVQHRPSTGKDSSGNANARLRTSACPSNESRVGVSLHVKPERIVRSPRWSKSSADQLSHSKSASDFSTIPSSPVGQTELKWDELDEKQLDLICCLKKVMQEGVRHRLPSEPCELANVLCSGVDLTEWLNRTLGRTTCIKVYNPKEIGRPNNSGIQPELIKHFRQNLRRCREVMWQHGVPKDCLFSVEALLRTHKPNGLLELAASVLYLHNSVVMAKTLNPNRTTSHTHRTTNHRKAVLPDESQLSGAQQTDTPSQSMIGLSTWPQHLCSDV
ncbi:hypothetical protein EG68_04040 [Paragonimus skrjabini miyazakii]|uniref:Uncharacterized protein n=1 Tax=Paragonimus skrjabini miyazakii TaxID=59628 RepID=A0A8S9YHH2_9TREM|nr:hypothetical protein EG68_04040 [Paragonimus skrjabini miyazakii]